MNLSQEEIDAMLSGKSGDTEENNTEEGILDGIQFDTETAVPEKHVIPEASLGMGEMIKDESFNADDWLLSPEEEDILGEVGNMCMGAVATTMYTLLDKRVSITTPKVSVHTTREVLSVYQTPFVIVEVEYVEGIDGKNVLLLKEYDAALITDLLMGGEGIVEEPIELSELHMSAISEIMNQMIGASATALSQVVHVPVNISTPVSDRIEFDGDVSKMLDYSAVVIRISFDMEIEGLLKSQLLQLMPYEVGRNMAKTLKDALYGTAETEANETPEPPVTPAQAPESPATATQAPAAQAPAAAQEPVVQQESPYPQQAQPYGQPNYGNYQQPYGQVPQPYYGQPQPYYGQPAVSSGNLVDVRPVQYESFAPPGLAMPPNGLGMVHDIPLQVSVELGKAKKEISEILEFGVGTVIVLDKVAGDPVEILANGKLIARGEVVVIEENYGVRITEVIGNN